MLLRVSDVYLFRLMVDILGPPSKFHTTTCEYLSKVDEVVCHRGCSEARDVCWIHLWK